MPNLCWSLLFLLKLCWSLTWEGRNSNIAADCVAKRTLSNNLELCFDEFSLDALPSIIADQIAVDTLAGGARLSASYHI